MGRRLPTPLRFPAVWVALATCLSTGPVHAAEIVESMHLSDQELETLVGPVALYPDDLLAIVLPAATFPLQVVQAARYLDELDADPGLSAGADWDESVVALLNYPEALRLLNDDLDWTWELGQAVLHQEQALIAAVKRFRLVAHDAGNLVSDGRQHVTVVEEDIYIRPANPQVIYVPYYQPARVRTYQRSPVYYYHARPYPVYYYPYAAGHYFSDRHFWGVTSVFSIGWQTRNVHYHLHQHRSHPYYGRKYAYDHHGYWRPRNTLRHRPEYRRPAQRHTEPTPRSRPHTQARETRVRSTRTRETGNPPTQSARHWGNARERVRSTERVGTTDRVRPDERARSFSRGRHPH